MVACNLNGDESVTMADTGAIYKQLQMVMIQHATLMLMVQLQWLIPALFIHLLRVMGIIMD